MGFNEITGNMWDIEADAYCITTNGFVKKNGEAVMGAGCAKEAKDRFKDISKILGQAIKQTGNRVCPLYKDNSTLIIAFPVKHNWWEKANLELIEQSAKDLMLLTNTLKFKKVILPRPGCGNGHLRWEDVKKVIESILDERIWVISK